MRTITVFSFFVSIWYLFFIVPPLSGESTIPAPPGAAKTFPYAFSVKAVAGLLYGQGEEIVYKYEDNDIYYSQLLWDLKPLFYAGSSLSFSLWNPRESPGFFSEFLLRFGVPRHTGDMEDRDWMSNYNEDLTNFSSHDNYTEGALLMDFSAGLSFPLAIGPLFKLFLGFSYMRFKWIARDGYYQYAESTGGKYEPWDASIEKTPVYGPAIAYSQEWAIFTLGASLFVPLLPFFSLDFSFQFGPAAFCYAQDDHFERKRQFIDYVYRGLMFEGRGELVFSFNQRVSLSPYCGYRLIMGGRGESYIRQSGTGGDGIFDRSAYDTAGAGYAALDTGLILKVRF
jgi:outer membrane protease